MQSPETRKSLIVRLRDASQDESWREFVAIYEPLIYRIARAKGLQHVDAQDMTQEVFITVGKAIDRFDLDSEKGSFRVTQNLVINFLTRDKEARGSGNTEIQLLLQELPDADEATATLFQVERKREIFRWAAQRVRTLFQEETWRAFWLTGVEGESIDDVAKLLGKSPGAIRVARCRVLARLQQEVKTFEE